MNDPASIGAAVLLVSMLAQMGVRLSESRLRALAGELQREDDEPTVSMRAQGEATH